MHDKIEYTITPEELLRNNSVTFSKKGNWLSCKYCPFCHGGKTGQVYTFGVRSDDYNYNCLRTTCGKAGSFWTLLQHFNLNPRDYVVKRSNQGNYTKKESKPKKYIYHRKS